MIDFALDDRMEALREFLHGFAVDELRPRARAADLAGTVEPEVIARLGEMAGDRAAIVPPLRSDEGLDGGPRSDGMVAVVGGEELAWGDAAMILNIPGPGLAGPSISSAGTPDQHRRFLSEIFDGGAPRFGALAVTEAQAGSDVSPPSTRGPAERARNSSSSSRAPLAWWSAGSSTSWG